MQFFFGLTLFLSTANAANPSSPITKSQFFEVMKSGLPNQFCADKKYFRACFRVTEDECIKEAVRATKVCLVSMDKEIPTTLKPEEGHIWGTKIGSCAGTGYDTSLAKRKIASKDCNDPGKWK